MIKRTREILFRGKRTDNGEWVEGYLTRRPSAIQYGAHYSPWFIYTPPSDPDDSDSFNNVERETVGQFTGLTDKNGKNIFEGDIVKESVRNAFSTKIEFVLHTVEFSLGFCGFEPFANYDSDCGIFTKAEDCEVIGNIHDTPELLEREAK